MSQNGTNDSEALQQAPSKPTFRRLVVMFDGTGNTRQSMTNVSRMFEAIDDSHPQSYKCIRHGIPDSKAESGPLFPACTRTVHCEKCSQPTMEQLKHEGDESKPYLRAGFPCDSCHQFLVEPELQPLQLVKYIKGVGTDYLGLIGKATGQCFGYGLSDKIKEGYGWLCNFYQEGDEVFVFGFSRGAFAARSLVSLLHRCDGVFKKPDDSHDDDDTKTQNSKDLAEAIEIAYASYEKCEKLSIDEYDNAEQKDVFNEYLKKENIRIERLHVQVKMLGVWDTVGALGFPESKHAIFNKHKLSRAQYKFHEQGLPCIVENAYHALALDEYRKDFEATLWPNRYSEEQEVKQVWFVGSHCNVGGGADLDDVVDPDDLWQYSYVWMQRHAEKHGLRFFWSYESPATGHDNLRTRRVSLREPEPSHKNFLKGIYPWLSPPHLRSIDPNLAMLHWSVEARLNVTNEDLQEQNRDLGKQWTPYRPASLLGNHKSEVAKNDARKKFLATVIHEGSTEVIAPYQVDAWGIHKKAAPKWHIETDDVTKCSPLKLTPRKKNTEKNREGKEKGDKKVG